MLAVFLEVCAQAMRPSSLARLVTVEGHLCGKPQACSAPPRSRPLHPRPLHPRPAHPERHRPKQTSGGLLRDEKLSSLARLGMAEGHLCDKPRKAA